MTTMLVSDDAGIADMAGKTAAAGFPHIAALLRAARDGRIGLLIPNRNAALSKRRLRRIEEPVIALLGDDDYQSTGPDGWACAPALTYWARLAIIHAAGAEADHYHQAVADCVTTKRLASVETSTAFTARWIEHFAIAGISVRAILPRDQKQHPLPIKRSEMH